MMYALPLRKRGHTPTLTAVLLLLEKLRIAETVTAPILAVKKESFFIESGKILLENARTFSIWKLGMCADDC
jgi:hypothetical protein